MIMRKIAGLLFVVALILTGCTGQKQQKDELHVNFTPSEAHEVLDVAVQHYLSMKETIPSDAMPRTFQGDTMVFSNIWWWCSGFYPGTLWYLHEYSGDETLKQEAHVRTLMLDSIQYRTDDHDVGFQLYCSYGNGLRITGDTANYYMPLVNGAKSLSTRFNEQIGSLRSWDWDNNQTWKFPVIIDNMMNLELLTWASRIIPDESIAQIALTHANTTMKNHYREDNSSWHVVDYDPETGEVMMKMTWQGFNDGSAWSRGQAWGLYGYTMMYRETSEQRFLEQAIKIANFMLDHPRMPEDKIPYWDFDAPDIPEAKRDASAGAIMASALLELGGMVDSELQTKFYNAATRALATLSSPAYLATPGTNGNFILKHSVGHHGGNSEVDVPLTYADYYFVEALIRYLNITK
jgi:unsaturated chondroitin disaccharide hydrolase